MKKVLIVDDSAVMRSLMSAIINKESGICVADTAQDGSVAIQLLRDQNRYDLILLDIRMPKISGVGVLEFMNVHELKIPTLIVSSEASKSTAETMRALELGAYDFVKKPGTSQDSTMVEFRQQLLEKIRCAFTLQTHSGVQLAERRTAEPREEKEQVPARQIAQKHTVERREEKEQTTEEYSVEKGALRGGAVGNRPGGDTIMFIASSTGGPKALQSLIPVFPDNLSCPVVVVQHMPEGFTASLAARLNEMSRCEVREAADGDVLQNGVVYVAKGGYQLRVKQVGRSHQLSERKDEPRNGLRPCADVFLESLQDSGYRRVVCAVLTGMGSDATSGLLELKRSKEVSTVGQSQKTCVVYGMPRSAVQAGVVDVVVDLEQIGDLLTKMIV